MNTMFRKVLIVCLFLFPCLISAHPAAEGHSVALGLALARQHLVAAQHRCDAARTEAAWNAADEELRRATDILTALGAQAPELRLDRVLDAVGKARFQALTGHDRESARAYLHGPIVTLEAFIREVAAQP